MSKTRWEEVYSLEFKVKFSVILQFGLTVGWIPSSEAKGCVIGFFYFLILAFSFWKPTHWARKEGGRRGKKSRAVFIWLVLMFFGRSFLWPKQLLKDSYGHSVFLILLLASLNTAPWLWQGPFGHQQHHLSFSIYLLTFSSFCCWYHTLWQRPSWALSLKK